MNNKQVFLLLTNRHDRKLFAFYREIKEHVNESGDVYILYHQTRNHLPKWIKRCNNYPFSYDSLAELKYTSLDKNLIPGSNHFPVLEFFLKNPHYKYYWCIEDDVRFSGSWRYFFNEVNTYEHDFLSCHVAQYRNFPNWYWWHALGHPSEHVQYSDRLKSFNPIYRISNAALQYIHSALKNKWFGHHEVLIPTLLFHGGYKIGDFGGDGEYVIPNFRNQFYNNEIIEDKTLLSTVRWRPAMSCVGNNPNKLYHPVKD